MENLEAIEYLNQAKSFVGTEQYDYALEAINKALNCDKMNIEYYIEKAIILANLEKYADAIDVLKLSLKIDKKNPEVYFHIGNISLLMDDKTAGIENYNKAIANGFDDSEIYYNLGLMYEEDDKIDLAIRNYSKAIIKDPLNVEARVRKANIYIAGNKYPEALETLNELILADPDLFEGYHLKAVLLSEMGEYEQAINVLDNASLLFPKDPAFILDKINICVLMNQIDDAKSLINRLEADYELSPDNKRQLYLEKSRLYAMDADILNVISSLMTAKNVFSTEYDGDIDAEATFLLVNCYMETKEYDKAIEMSKELINSNELEYSIPSYYTLPYCYQQKGDEEKANLLYKESISKLRSITLKNPEILDGYFFRALCLKELKEIDKAMELCDYLLKIDDKSSLFHSLKAEILFADGQEELAKQEKSLSESLK